MAGRPVADPELEAYASAHTTAPPPWLVAVAEGTRAFSDAHGMMVGDVVGRLLAILVAATGARRVLEVGTFTGYSALSMAEALPPDGRIVTLEVDPAHAAKAREHIAASPHADRIEVRIGPAIESLARLEGTFDLAFIDADKPGYVDYYEALVPRLRTGGLLVADNVLWSGRVADASDEGRETRALRAFNERVVLDPRVECTLLTVRDGLMLARRLP
jgi:caffeoyl-CoA O-methyltransferase